MPPVAPSSGPPRRPEGQRPSGPESKSQAPDQRFTPEQLREMMRRGQLGSAPPAPGRGPGHGRPEGPRPGHGPAGPGLASRVGPGKLSPAPPPPPPTDEEEDRKGKGARLGSPADRAGRRAKRTERANERKSSISSPLPASALLEVEEEGRRSRGPKRHHKKHAAAVAQKKSSATVEPPVTVRDLSEAIGVKANELMRKFMQLTNQLVTINAVLEDEAAIELAMEFGVELTIAHARTAEDEMLESIGAPEGAPEDLRQRPPVVTILGHVDHGKTSLLDYIRKANVVASESGGITQHIGAYTVEHDGKPITFVDTPGHEAFTAMRARGANVTDVAVVVVAADDGVMPQTREAISHAKAAGVHIVVALNKIDLPGAEANVLRILNELSQEGLIPEEYGGDVPVVRTSAVSGRGVDELLATLATIAEVYEFKANPDRPATGTCLEASLSEGRGVVATVLVQDGTLRVGDVVVCGDAFGRVRALMDDKGRALTEAGPSTPVELSGLDAVPTAGEKFAVVDDIIRARSIAETRRDRTRGSTLVMPKAITLENLYSRMSEQKVKSLNLILKADVQGSLEALVKELDKLQNDEVPIRILHKGVGGIGESDVLLADASEAIIIGFRVAPEDRAMSLAEEKSIDIRRYDIIYQVADEVKQAIEGRLEPEIKEVHLGRAVVRQVFKISRGGVGSVAGCFVTQGVIERSAQARIIREGREIYKGTIEALKRFKDDVREVRENFECGIKVSRFDDIKTDDVIEAYRIDVIKRTL